MKSVKSRDRDRADEAGWHGSSIAGATRTSIQAGGFSIQVRTTSGVSRCASSSRTMVGMKMLSNSAGKISLNPISTR
jgi:hypothetical protein